MFVLHIWMDYAWLSATAFASSKFAKIITNRSFKFLIIGLSIVLVYFGIAFLIDAFA